MDQVNALQNRMNRTVATPLFYKVFAMVAAGMILDGADVYLVSAVNSVLIQNHFATLSQGSMFLSAGFLGLFLGSLLAGYIGDHFGRRASYQINLLIFGAFTVFGGFAPNIWALIVLRFIAAIGLGAEIVTGFAMINEFAPVKSRGKWSASVSVIANTAAPLTLMMSAFVIPRYSWRAMFMIVGGAAMVLWFIRRNFPESPRWLIDQGRYEEAEEIINQMEGDCHDYTEEDQTPQPVHQTKIGTGLLVAIFAVSAINLVQYTFTSWMPTLLVKQGIEVAHSLTFSAVMMAGAPLGAMIGATLVDQLGRKKVIVSTFIFAAIVGLIYAQQRSVKPILIVGFILVTSIYVLMASIVSVYVPELFPTSFRFRGAGIANGVAKMLTVLTPYIAAWALARMSSIIIFEFMASVAVIAAIVVWIFGPETKKRTIR
ncbi:MFS transporter [Fructobacillus ficulneus]|uniref:Major facilitator superfamily permease n=1 Tax=Fructobacillus ficulneus TaxID=157463 RepID=A0A0K8MHE2_9LACO|nr:MFS transporter [Fructobacillus ficulneus]GAO99603.1 major facilitator superfamily permease [Fructobacillus ficulneus]